MNETLEEEFFNRTLSPYKKFWHKVMKIDLPLGLFHAVSVGLAALPIGKAKAITLAILIFGIFFLTRFQQRRHYRKPISLSTVAYQELSFILGISIGSAISISLMIGLQVGLVVGLVTPVYLYGLLYPGVAKERIIFGE